MIRVEEKILAKNTITLKLDGVLDHGAIAVIKSVFDRHREGNRKLLLDLKGLVHITREGRSFLSDIKQDVNIIHIPEFMELENGL